MKIKQFLQYEKFFWAITLIIVYSFTVYYGWQEKAGIESLYIYGCPASSINPLTTCAEEDKIVVGLEVDHEYNFETGPSGTVYDPYGHYARKKRLINYIIAVIVILGSLALFKLYRAVKRNPKIIEYFKRRVKEHGKE